MSVLKTLKILVGIKRLTDSLEEISLHARRPLSLSFSSKICFSFMKTSTIDSSRIFTCKTHQMSLLCSGWGQVDTQPAHDRG